MTKQDTTAQLADLKIDHLRRSYEMGSIDESEFADNPVNQFTRWFEEVKQGEILEPNAMVLSTVDKNGCPNSRTVLLKQYSDAGFVFFTNYHSHKAADIEHKPFASLHFLWLSLERQIKIRGRVEKISKQESEEYFHSRPHGSQLGAWASRQSEEVASRDELVERFDKIKKRFSNGKVDYPLFWGGYRVIPFEFEFWQGGRDRIHDRIVYTKEADGWQISRRSP